MTGCILMKRQGRSYGDRKVWQGWRSCAEAWLDISIQPGIKSKERGGACPYLEDDHCNFPSKNPACSGNDDSKKHLFMKCGNWIRMWIIKLHVGWHCLPGVQWSCSNVWGQPIGGEDNPLRNKIISMWVRVRVSSTSFWISCADEALQVTKPSCLVLEMGKLRPSMARDLLKSCN